MEQDEQYGQEEDEAAQKIQSAYKNKMNKRKEEQEKQEQLEIEQSQQKQNQEDDEAALKIQSAYKNKMNNRKEQLEQQEIIEIDQNQQKQKQEEDEAARKIQSAYKNKINKRKEQEIKTYEAQEQESSELDQNNRQQEDSDNKNSQNQLKNKRNNSPKPEKMYENQQLNQFKQDIQNIFESSTFQKSSTQKIDNNLILIDSKSFKQENKFQNSKSSYQDVVKQVKQCESLQDLAQKYNSIKFPKDQKKQPQIDLNIDIKSQIYQNKQIKSFHQSDYYTYSQKRFQNQLERPNFQKMQMEINRKNELQPEREIESVSEYQQKPQINLENINELKSSNYSTRISFLKEQTNITPQKSYVSSKIRNLSMLQNQKQSSPQSKRIGFVNEKLNQDKLKMEYLYLPISFKINTEEQNSYKSKSSFLLTNNLTKQVLPKNVKNSNMLTCLWEGIQKKHEYKNQTRNSINSSNFGQLNANRNNKPGLEGLVDVFGSPNQQNTPDNKNRQSNLFRSSIIADFTKTVLGDFKK